MTEAVLKGKDFVALRRLSNAADTTLADVGKTCERVPASSLPLLLASGKIAPKNPIAPVEKPAVPVAPAAAKPKGKA